MNVLVLVLTCSNTFQRIEDEAEEYWSLLRFRMAIEYLQRPPLPSPFILLWHALLLVRFGAQRLGYFRVASALSFLEPCHVNRTHAVIYSATRSVLVMIIVLVYEYIFCTLMRTYTYSTVLVLRAEEITPQRELGGLRWMKTIQAEDIRQKERAQLNDVDSKLGSLGEK